MEDTKTIQLPSGGEAVIKTAITNRVRKGFAKAKDDIDLAVDLSIKAVLVKYKEAEGTEEAYEALMDSTSAEDFELISTEIESVLSPEKSPKE